MQSGKRLSLGHALVHFVMLTATEDNRYCAKADGCLLMHMWAFQGNMESYLAPSSSKQVPEIVGFCLTRAGLLKP